MSLYYKLSVDESVERFRKLWAREAQDKVLVKIDIQDNIYYPHFTTMSAMSKVPDYEQVVDEWEKGFKADKDINDDNLPVAYGELGSYIIGGFLGANVRWATGGAFPEKLINDMKYYKEYLGFDIEENDYYKMHFNYIKYLSERAEGKFGFTEMFPIDGLNFLECVRHNDAYTDIYDYPKEAIDIMNFGSDFNISLIKTQRQLIKKYKDGRFNFYGIWTPNETVFISVDAYGNCNPEIFEKFGRKYVQRMANEFGGWLHLHTDSMSTMRLLSKYVTLKNLIAIGFDDWIEKPRAIENINAI